MMIARIFVVFSSLWLLMDLNTGSVLMPANNGHVYTDSALIAKGELTFNQYCTGCHNFRQDGIGPQLGGLTSRASTTWIASFIKDPQKKIRSGDKRSQELFKKYK